MPSAAWWKEFYRNEREQLGRNYLERLIESAEETQASDRSAIIFPHTRLSESGELIASAALSVMRSGAESVLALGVLHGIPRGDESLQGIHGPGAPNDRAIWTDEFSLDNFEAMIEIASDVCGVKKPRLVARFPFLTGDDPRSLPGFDELRSLVRDGAQLVATADMIHHGVGYGTPPEEQRKRDDPETEKWARAAIEDYLGLLRTGRFDLFQKRSSELRSDFRDGGPVLASMIEESDAPFVVKELRRVNYADVLEADDPTWVAAALVVV